MQQFVGSSRALSTLGLSAATGAIGVAVEELWAVIAVETSGCGFLADRRPQILYERHVFHALTHGRFDDGDISDAASGGYGAGGPHQYGRLDRALQLNRDAALQSASWGLGQILGRNCAMAGYADVDSFVQAMVESEDRQLAAVASFIRAAGLDAALQAHDWSRFARGYNGPAYAMNQYDIRLRGEYHKCAAGVLPSLDIRAAQLYLCFNGFNPGPIDGFLGPLTRSAIIDCQREHGLPQTGEVDDALLALLTPGEVPTH